MARAGRRRDALYAAEFEQEREQLLLDQLNERVAEAVGWRTDEAALAQLQPGDAAALRRMSFLLEPPEEDELANLEEEIARLEGEIEECRRRREALERYVEALGE